MYSTLGNPKHGGALFTLSRELRDEIYRFVVRKRYIIYITHRWSCDPVPSRGKHDFAILQVSKAVNDEVSDILYAESVFRFSMDFSAYVVSSVPAHLINRMRIMELDFDGLSYHPGCRENTNVICDAVVAGLASSDIKRNHLHIRIIDCCPDWMSMLSRYLSKMLNAFIGFRTVRIEVDSISASARYLAYAQTMWIYESFVDLQKEMTSTMGQQILEVLTPTLGPAETAVPGNFSCYILHPQDYLASSAR